MVSVGVVANGVLGSTRDGVIELCGIIDAGVAGGSRAPQPFVSATTTYACKARRHITKSEPEPTCEAFRAPPRSSMPRVTAEPRVDPEAQRGQLSVRALGSSYYPARSRLRSTAP